MNETRPLDPMALLLAQLGRIEKNIEALPAVVARLDALSERLGALTESTRQLETAWRENVRDLSLRDAEQQRAIADMGLRLSELLAATSAISAGLQEQKGYAVDVGRRVVALEQGLAALVDFKNRHEDAGRRIGQVERQVESVMDSHSKLNMRVRAAEERQGDQGFRERLEACSDEFLKIRPDINHVQGLVSEFAEWRPWLRGLKWGLGIVGGLLLTALATGILWAIIQSGGGL